MISAIIFSKDRPMQLEALLDSIKKNCPFIHPLVLLHATNKESREGYNRCYEAHNDVFFGPQEELINQKRITFSELVIFLSSQSSYSSKINQNSNELQMFLVDDIIFYRKVDIDKKIIEEEMSKSENCCFSLRLGLNTTDQLYCDTPYKSSLVDYSDKGVFISWDRTRYQPWYHWNYPASVDGHIFRKQDIQMLLKGQNFRTPNEMEEKMFLRSHLLPPTMLSGKNSFLVNLPFNKVQDYAKNRAGLHFPLDPQSLTQEYNKGVRLDWESMDFSNITSTHQEIKPKFKDGL